MHSGGACILYLKNMLPNISNFCGLGRLNRLKGMFLKNLQPKNRVFIQKNTEGHRYSPESSDFFILAYFNKRRARFYGGGTVSYIIYIKKPNYADSRSCTPTLILLLTTYSVRSNIITGRKPYAITL